MDPSAIDILDLGLRIESAGDARLAHWLVERAGAERVRHAARALRARRAPPPQRVARELGVDEATVRLAAHGSAPVQATRHDLRQPTGFGSDPG